MFGSDDEIVTRLEPGPEQESSLVRLKSDTAGAANTEKEEMNLSDLQIMTITEPLGKESCVATNAIRNPFEREDIEEIADGYLQTFPSELMNAELVNDIPTEFYGPEELQQGLKDLVWEFRDRFRRTVSEEPANLEPFRLEVDQEKWNHHRLRGPRKMDKTREEECRRQIQILLEHGLIQESRASQYSHVLLVPKANGKWRFCVDYTDLNKITNKEGWPIPNIQLLLNRIGDKKPKFFIVLDLTSGYFQIPVDEESRKYTAFITSGGLYEWTRLPMGLKGAPAFFQRSLMTKVLAGIIQIICELYLDDLILHAQTIQELITNFRKVLERFRDYNIYINPDKCKLGVSEVTYVGHTINSEGIHFSRSKIEGIMNIPLPNTQGGLKSFLGMANFFRDHVRGFAIKAQPLYRMLQGYKKRGTLVWNESLRKLFEEIKSAINDCPRLFFMDETSPIHLYTDASDVGIGAYLAQIVEGTEKPIGFVSKAFDDRMKNWDVPQKEGFAIYFALDKWAYLLRDKRFVIHTDHKNLLSLKEDYQDNKKVQRWLRCFQSYDYELVMIEGSKNTIADAFSRLCVITIDDTRKEEHQDLCALDSEDDEGGVNTTPSQTGEGENTASNSRIPRKENKILKRVHNELVGHHGVDRMIQLLNENGENWDERRKHVQMFIKSCPACQKNNQRRSLAIARPFTLSSENPMQKMYVDLIEDLREDEDGNRHIFVAIDAFSRYLMLYPIKEKTAQAVARAFLSLIGDFGAPRNIVSDRGPCFVSELWSELLQLIGSEHELTLGYSKEENGMVERANKEVMRHLRNIIFDRNVIMNWSRYLPLVKRIFNASIHSITGVSPARVIHGNAIDLNQNILGRNENNSTPIVYMDSWINSLIQGQQSIISLVQKNLGKQRERHLTQVMGGEVVEFPIGSFVLVEHTQSNLRRGPKSKLLPFLKGPMKVISINGDKYLLRNLVTRRDKEYHIKRLFEYRYDPSTLSPLKVACKDSGEQFPVEYIEKARGSFKDKTKMEFLVHWIGHDEPTWEPWKNVRTTHACYYFLKNHPNEKYREMIPKNIKFVDSDDEIESDQEEEEIS